MFSEIHILNPACGRSDRPPDRLGACYKLPLPTVASGYVHDFAPRLMLTYMTMCVTAHQESFPGFELDGDPAGRGLDVA